MRKTKFCLDFFHVISRFVSVIVHNILLFALGHCVKFASTYVVSYFALKMTFWGHGSSKFQVCFIKADILCSCGKWCKTLYCLFESAFSLI